MIEDVDKDENCVTKEHMEEDQETYARILPASSIEKRISAMEEKLDILLNKCAQLESDNQQLTKELALKKDGSKSNKVEASFDEEENLHNLKKRGFIRPGPQVQSESKSNKSVVTCEECNCVLESQGLLDAHKQIHVKPTHKCETCDKAFISKSEFDVHQKTKHIVDMKKKSKQYNCEDCPFQGENGLELKRHISRTQHTPSDYVEECYTCKKEFNSYFLLMNHRKLEHPSTKTCRFFLKKACIFVADECWYKHQSTTEVKPEVEGSNHGCKYCDFKGAQKSDLMKHMKEYHLKTVAKCRNYLQQNCNLPESICWFMHQEQNDVANESPDQYIIPDEGSDLPGMVDDNHDEKDSVFTRFTKRPHQIK